MRAEQAIIKMMEYLQSNQIHHAFENHMDLETDTDTYIFTFYSFETFFKFMTRDFNCLRMKSYHMFKSWYKDGIINPNLIHPMSWSCNTCFVDINCVCICVNKNICQEVYIDTEYIRNISLTPAQGSISVYYEMINNDECIVFIRIPMFSFPNVRLQPYMHDYTHTYHTELKEYFSFPRVKAVHNLKEYDLYEPCLEKHILKYIAYLH